MDEKLIAPCGMNCSLCIAYQFKENGYKQTRFSQKILPWVHSKRRKLHAYERCVRIACKR